MSSIFTKLKRQLRMDNPEIPATLGTRATGRRQTRQNKNQKTTTTKKTKKNKKKQTKTEKMSNTNPQKKTTGSEKMFPPCYSYSQGRYKFSR